MPKDTLKIPVSGIFAVAKPSGPRCMDMINGIKPLIAGSRLFVDPEKLERQDKKQKRKGRFGRDVVKIGQGGTLDPLADGVLVIAVGKGTKQLTGFLDCVKEYRTTCLLGCETNSYDSEGAKVRSAPWRHVTRESVESALEQFRGEIEQTPPIFSALKMDGRPLHEYARQGIPLPRPIAGRNVTVHSLELEEWLGPSHTFRHPEKELTSEEKAALEKSLRGVDASASVADDPQATVETQDISPNPDAPDTDIRVPTAFVLRMTVSGGTYVRSIVHDLAHVVGSAGHVVTLTRTKQGRFALEPVEEERGCVPWEVFERAVEGAGGEMDGEGWCEWEREVLERMEVVE